jgi:hypothetical protein
MALLIPIILILLVIWLFYGGERTKSSRKARRKINRVERIQSKYSSQSLELKQQLRELAQIAWSTEQAFSDPAFCLRSNALAKINSPQQVLDIFLTHARRIAPGFAVPHLVPHVDIARMPRFWAGAFEVDSEGWVKIGVSQDFMSDNLAAQAILAHEICHYILGNAGLCKPDTYEDERYTDLCMFVLGFDEVFLNGYNRPASQSEYRPGHHLGYLTDDEYQLARQYVKQLRQTSEIAPPKELETLQQRLNQLTRDREVSQWVMTAARNKFPDRSEVELLRHEVDRLEWERRRR